MQGRKREGHHLGNWKRGEANRFVLCTSKSRTTCFPLSDIDIDIDMREHEAWMYEQSLQEARNVGSRNYNLPSGRIAESLTYSTGPELILCNLLLSSEDVHSSVSFVHQNSPASGYNRHNTAKLED